MIGPSFFAFLLVIIIILIFSKYELSIVLMIAAVIFAFLAQVNIIESFVSVIINPSIILLAIAVLFIPILGRIMEESGLMLELIQKMKVSKKASLMITPAFFGLLPVAGGALMSAPIVEQIAPQMDPNRKVAINVWYRHVLIFIYPLSAALIVGSMLANISIYLLVIALIIPLIILLLVGYFTLIRNVEGTEVETERDIKRVFHNILPLIIAPLIDFVGRIFFDVPYPEIFLLLGLTISMILALRFAHMSPKSLKRIAKKMKVWRFPLLIVAMFFFLEIFIRSGVPEEISNLNLNFVLFICIGFLLGFVTGRIQVPISILIPIYIIQNGLMSVLILDFVFIYCAVFLGYLITPIHPCVAYTTEFFETNFKGVAKHLLPPTIICFGLLLLITLIVKLA